MTQQLRAELNPSSVPSTTSSGSQLSENPVPGTLTSVITCTHKIHINTANHTYT